MSLDRQSLIMQMLAARAGLPSNKSASELTSELAQGNPQLEMLMQIINQGAKEVNQDEDADLDVSVASYEPENITPHPEYIEQNLKIGMRETEEEVNELRSRCDTLAAALGACFCWGTEPACRNCRGAGVVGWRVPEKVLFYELVVPAVQRYKQHKNTLLSQSPKKASTQSQRKD